MNNLSEVVGYVNEYFGKGDNSNFIKVQIKIACNNMKFATEILHVDTEDSAMYFCVGLLGQVVRKYDVDVTTIPTLSPACINALLTITNIYKQRSVLSIPNRILSTNDDLIVSTFYTENQVFLHTKRVIRSKNKTTQRYIARSIENVASCIKYFIEHGYDFKEIEIV